MKKVLLPKYNLCEELINAITHGIGAIFGVVALVLTVIFAARNHNVIGIVSSAIYGATMIIMYVISCLYHSFSPKLKAKKVFRIIDHCDIYLFIAGSYTPFCLSLIGGTIGWTIFGVIWFCALLGVILNAINLEKFKVLSVIMYLVMGWMIIFSFSHLKAVMPWKGISLLLSGGIVYTIGAILYAIGSKKRYFHSIFHFFVLGGSILQMFSILFYAI